MLSVRPCFSHAGPRHFLKTIDNHDFKLLVLINSVLISSKAKWERHIKQLPNRSRGKWEAIGNFMLVAWLKERFISALISLRPGSWSRKEKTFSKCAHRYYTTSKRIELESCGYFKFALTLLQDLSNRDVLDQFIQKLFRNKPYS